MKHAGIGLERARRSCRFLLALLWLTCGTALAQPAAPAAPAAPPAGSQVLLRSLWPEVAITVVMVVLAMYAVCRNSRRQ